MRWMQMILTVTLAVQSAWAGPFWGRRSLPEVGVKVPHIMLAQMKGQSFNVQNFRPEESIQHLVKQGGREEKLNITTFMSYFSSDISRQALNLESAYQALEGRSDKETLISIATLITLSEKADQFQLSRKSRSLLLKWVLQFTADWTDQFLQAHGTDAFQQVPAKFVEAMNLALPPETKEMLERNASENKSKMYQLLKKLDTKLVRSLNAWEKEQIKTETQKKNNTPKRIKTLSNLIGFTGVSSTVLIPAVGFATSFIGGDVVLSTILSLGLGLFSLYALTTVADNIDRKRDFLIPEREKELNQKLTRAQEQLASTSIYMVATQILKILFTGEQEPN